MFSVLLLISASALLLGSGGVHCGGSNGQLDYLPNSLVQDFLSHIQTGPEGSLENNAGRLFAAVDGNVADVSVSLHSFLLCVTPCSHTSGELPNSEGRRQWRRTDDSIPLPDTR